MIGFSSLYYSCEKETTISERDEDIAKTIESRTDGSSQTIIDILASGSSIGKDIDVRVQLNDGSITRDWSQDISSLESPIIFMHEEPFIDPALPDGTCCEIKILHPYNQSGQMMIFIGEKGIDSNDGYASQFVDFDIDKIEPEQIIQFMIIDIFHMHLDHKETIHVKSKVDLDFGGPLLSLEDMM